MLAWAEATLALGSTIVGAVLGERPGGAFLVERSRRTYDRQERKRMKGENLNVRLAEAIAPIPTLLRGIDADLIEMIPADAVRRLVLDLIERWEGMRNHVVTAASSHPDPEIRERCERLVDAVNKAVTAPAVLVEASLRSSPEFVAETIEDTRTKQTSALALADGLLLALVAE